MTMKAKTYVILDRAVEEGVAVGLRRAHKHTDNPDHSHIEKSVQDAVMNSICEVFSFEDDYYAGDWSGKEGKKE